MADTQQASGLPPKTCTIERLVTRPDDRARIVAGKKTAVRRNGRYADVGERFDVEGHSFVVTRVYRQRFGEMTAADYASEGVTDRIAYEAHLQAVHPGGLRLQDDMQVWVHEFSRTGDGAERG
ncbi:MAG: ASCH domain-containing protein [Firmicutes bacterium]|nr:ASCH domain-containing protein [Bacillota bacterium]